TELVHYTKDGLVNFKVSNCGRNVFQQLTAFSENQAFAVNGFITVGTVFNARTKLTFDQTNIVLCGEEDVDQDGFPASDDCDDENANINPGAVEITYNGIDDDCDSTSLDDDLDLDGYGFGSDCNDDNAQIHPGQEEIIYNGIDDDCDSTSLDDDLDMDGFLFKDDCNDLASDTYPGAFEIPDNGIDEDCDGNDLITMTSSVAASKIYLLPNPTSGITFIQSNTDEVFIIKVLDVTGKLLLIKTETKEVDLTNMSNGLYFIELFSLSTGDHSINKMVVNK
ncbi:MAG TPA: MopE-related protein, partial [Saprospiraceae bacterium]|nr:MopE-related protein [Saprospiraceae bacterium]